MASIWRIQPGQRIRSSSLVRKAATDASQLIAAGFFVPITVPSPQSPPDFLTGWEHRKIIRLSRASGAVTNYQMKLKVGESSGSGANDVLATGCKTDFSDLRFTNADGGTLLNYYIEDVTGATPNQVATIWIKFDYIGTGATNFYMYYGNAGASAVSNGPGTFILFEDFNALTDGDLNGQNGWSGADSWDVATTTKYEGAKALESAGGGIETVTKAFSSGGAGYNIFAQARVQHTNVAQSNALLLYLFEGAALIEHVMIDNSEFKTGSPGSYIPIGKAASNDTWYKYMVALDAVNTHKTWVDDIQYSPADQSNYGSASYTIDRIDLQKYNASGTGFFDQIMIGYYLPTGPAWGSWGAEETFVGGGTIMNSHFFVMLLAGGGR